MKWISIYGSQHSLPWLGVNQVPIHMKGVGDLTTLYTSISNLKETNIPSLLPSLWEITAAVLTEVYILPHTYVKRTLDYSTQLSKALKWSTPTVLFIIARDQPGQPQEHAVKVPSACLLSPQRPKDLWPPLHTHQRRLLLQLPHAFWKIWPSGCAPIPCWQAETEVWGSDTESLPVLG